MKNNTSGGIVLLLVGAAIIAAGTTAKGKQIFNILMGGSAGTVSGSDLPPESTDPTPDRSGGRDEPTTPDNGYELAKADPKTLFGFVGERAAIVV